jgi:hypothetical protein
MDNSLRAVLGLPSSIIDVFGVAVTTKQKPKPNLDPPPERRPSILWHTINHHQESVAFGAFRGR